MYVIVHVFSSNELHSIHYLNLMYYYCTYM